jgi:hypothetical protein
MARVNAARDIFAAPPGIWTRSRTEEVLAPKMACTAVQPSLPIVAISMTAVRINRHHRDDTAVGEEFKYASPIFAKAEFGYFDENGDGRITKAEFVDKPSEFFLRFDKRHDCRVTPDEMNQVSPAAQGKPKMGRRGGAGGITQG